MFLKFAKHTILNSTPIKWITLELILTQIKVLHSRIWHMFLGGGTLFWAA